VFLTLLVSGSPGAFGERSIDSGFSVREVPELGLRLWTWNSGARNLGREAARLFDVDPGIEVVAACQQEAEREVSMDMSRDLRSRWSRIAYGRQLGVAGGRRNSQILSIFYRSESLKVAHAGWAEPEVRHAPGMLVKQEWLGDVDIPGVLRTSSRVHQRSDTGKGGVSALLHFGRSSVRVETSLALVCGHLSSESGEQRDADFKMLVAYGLRRAPDFRSIAAGIVRDDARQESASGAWTGGPGNRLLQVFMKTKRAQQEGAARAKLARELESEFIKNPLTPTDIFEGGGAGGRRVDAVIIAGDLNYRIVNRGALPLQDDRSMAMHLAGRWRSRTAAEDPLNRHGNVASDVVKPRGWNFRCNQPHLRYLPTYKRHDAEACKRVSDARSPDSDLDVSDVKRCLTKVSSRDWREVADGWKTKEAGKFLQAGWLDRACWRKLRGSSAELALVRDESWHDLGGSDHVAVVMDLVVFNPRRWCAMPVGDAGALGSTTVRRSHAPWWGHELEVEERFSRIAEGEVLQVVCPIGQAIVEEAARTVRCSSDLGGDLNISGRCRDICGRLPSLPGVQSFTIARHVNGELRTIVLQSGGTLLEGDAVVVNCRAFHWVERPLEARCTQGHLSALARCKQRLEPMAIDVDDGKTEETDVQSHVAPPHEDAQESQGSFQRDSSTRAAGNEAQEVGDVALPRDQGFAANEGGSHAQRNRREKHTPGALMPYAPRALAHHGSQGPHQRGDFHDGSSARSSAWLARLSALTIAATFIE